MSNLKFISWEADKKYSLVSGGLIDAIMKKLDVLQKGEPKLARRAILISLITWLPLMIITLLEGTFSGESVSISFMEDFAVHIRLLVVIPFLIVIEKVVDPAFDDYLNSTRRLIADNDEAEFTALTARIDTLSNSWIPEIVFIMIIYGVFFSGFNLTDIAGSRWALDNSDGGFDLAGAYYLFISIPVYQFLIIRWIWRWLPWAYSVIYISKLNLRIEASHADQMAGLEFMRLVPMTFCFLSLAFSAMYSALIGKDILYNGATLKEYYYPILFYAALATIVIHFPLIFMIPNLIKARARAMNKFSSLIQYHNNLYREKWLEGQLPKDDHILGSLDNSSIADINGSYQQAVKEMSVIPINRNSIVGAIILLIIPFIPLLFTEFSLKILLSKLLQVVSG